VTDDELGFVLFVYGSLKRGQANERELTGARYLGSALTAAVFALREIDGYPALVPGQRAVSGELYRLSPQQLSALDEFEGEAYVRCDIALASGDSALAYLARLPGAGEPFAFTVWPAPAERS
jgi:gamma-glutamylcyclotransferase (GGCT)/AIG2-like uncharacterized protein YtfP